MNLQTVIAFLLKYITFDNFVALLAVIGSAGTAWNILKSRKNIKIIPLGHKLDDNNDFILHFQLINKSHLPIAITELSLKINGVYYPSYKGHLIAASNVHERLGQTLIKDFYTQPFPLQLVGLGGISSYTVFELPKDIRPDFSKPLTFQVSTNRGKATEMSLLLHQTDN